MANLVANEILIADSIGNDHVVLSNQLGNLINESSESDDIVQPEKQSVTSHIDITQFREVGGSDVDVQDNWYVANTVKENGVYLVTYMISGVFTLDGGDDLDPEVAVFENIYDTSVEFTAKRFFKIDDYTTDTITTFSDDTGISNSVIGGNQTFISIEGATSGSAISFASEPNDWGTYVLAKYRIVGDRTITITKIG